MREIGQFVPYGLFGFFPDGTGVNQDKVCLAVVIGKRISFAGEYAGHNFTVGYVHLASVCFDEQFFPVQCFVLGAVGIFLFVRHFRGL